MANAIATGRASAVKAIGASPFRAIADLLAHLGGVFDGSGALLGFSVSSGEWFAVVRRSAAR